MSLQLVQGTIEIISVLIVDNSQDIFDLSGLTPTYDVVPVDPDTDEDDTPAKYTAEPCLNSQMLAQPLIDTTDGGLWERGKYRLYVSFIVGDGEVPKLGPIEFYVI